MKTKMNLFNTLLIAALVVTLPASSVRASVSDVHPVVGQSVDRSAQQESGGELGGFEAGLDLINEPAYDYFLDGYFNADSGWLLTDEGLTFDGEELTVTEQEFWTKSKLMWTGGILLLTALFAAILAGLSGGGSGGGSAAFGGGGGTGSLAELIFSDPTTPGDGDLGDTNSGSGLGDPNGNPEGGPGENGGPDLGDVAGGTGGAGGGTGGTFLLIDDGSGNPGGNGSGGNGPHIPGIPSNPEPSTLLLMGLGLLMPFIRRK